MAKNLSRAAPFTVDTIEEPILFLFSGHYRSFGENKLFGTIPTQIGKLTLLIKL
jgi:hypothetical protein